MLGRETQVVSSGSDVSEVVYVLFCLWHPAFVEIVKVPTVCVYENAESYGNVKLESPDRTLNHRLDRLKELVYKTANRRTPV